MDEKITGDIEVIYDLVSDIRDDDEPGRIIGEINRVIEAAERIKIIARLRQTAELVREREDDAQTD